MRAMKHNWSGCLWLVVLVLISTVCPASEPRLMQLFRKLEAGEPQVVVVYGTSLTLYGEWAVAMQGWFNTNYPGQVTFINSGGSGMNSGWGVTNLQNQVFDYRPDLVVVEFSFNDAHTNFNLSVAQARTNLSTIVSGIHEQDTDTTVLLQIMNVPWNAPGNAALAARPQLEAYNNNYRQFAETDDLPLLDHYPGWLALQQTNQALFQTYVPDGAHPNAAGSLAITWAALRDWLEKSRALTRQRTSFESLLQAANRSGENQLGEADICIYGGTSGGVIAAVQAARMGKSVILVSPTKHVGGMTTSGLGWTDLGSESILGGLSREFYHRLYVHYQKTNAWNWQSSGSFANVGQNGPAFNHTTKLASVFEPRVAEAVYKQMLAEWSVPVVYGLLDLTNGVTKQGQRITAIHMEDGSEYRAKMFIDASYEGDLLAKAGVSYTIGREANSTYGELRNGIQSVNAVKNQLPNGIDPYVMPGNPASGLLPGVNLFVGGADGTGDNKLQAYCYRMVLTDVAANRVPVAQPAGYNAADYELLFRAIAAGQSSAFFKFDRMPNRKTDSNNASGMSTDFIGGNYGPDWNWAEASHARRAQSAREHEKWQRGLIWTLQNHPSVPSSIRSAYANWGLPADEFADNGHWPYQIYVREARRMISDYVMTEANCLLTEVVPDSVGLAAYTMDSHNIQRHVKNGVVKNEGDVQHPTAGPYPIAYRAIIPRVGECENLLVPWCLSASHIAFGSIRMEPVFMILGQSAATAAALAIDDHVSVQALTYARLAAALKVDGQKLSASTVTAADIIIDNPAATALPGGAWTASSASAGYHGTDYLHDGNTNKGSKSVRYAPMLPAAGNYQVFLRWTQHANRSTTVPVRINYQGGNFTTNVNQRQGGAAWNLLGSFPFAAGTNGNLLIETGTATDGFVIADAAMWRKHTGVPEVNLHVMVPAGIEGQPPYPRVVFTRTGDPGAALAVKYSVAGTATPGSDYSALSGRFEIPAGATEASLGLRTIRDPSIEGSETVVLTLTPDAAYTIGAAIQAAVTIFDSPMDVWRAERFTPAELASPAISGWSADPDQDGWGNLFEFFSGTDPRQPDANSSFGVRQSSGDIFLDLIRNRTAAVMFGLDASVDLSAWTPLTNVPPDVVIQGPLEKMSWRRNPAPAEFFRLKLTPTKL
jgi:lysophospholipase L1-like esterase